VTAAAVAPQRSVELFGGAHHGDVLSRPPCAAWRGEHLFVRAADGRTEAVYERVAQNVAVYAVTRELR